MNFPRPRTCVGVYKPTDSGRKRRGQLRYEEGRSVTKRANRGDLEADQNTGTMRKAS